MNTQNQPLHHSQLNAMKNHSSYRDFCKPKLADLLSALKLDFEAESASGSYIESKDGRSILDLVSGFGTAILGHNHPELIKTAIHNLSNNIPINVQGTLRNTSGKLANRLNELLPNRDHEYCVNFSNSGAETIEAAIKHAYKVHFDKVLRQYERITRLLNDFYYRIEKMETLPELPGKNKNLIDFRDDLDEYNLAQFEDFQNRPVMLSFKGGYHGKTVSSLKVTFNKSFRESFEGLSAIKSVFVDVNKPERIAELINENECTFYYPTLVENRIELKPFKLTKVIAMIFEVVMGEGGIRPLPEKTLEYLADNHDQLKLPYIIDEIQTGCGRTGAIYGYGDTALAKISPEYITLSKALGGGIAKIGATMIRQDIYDQDFGILHTSTFGEDDLSSEVALSTLSLLSSNKNHHLKEAKTKGSRLLNELQKLQEIYPNIIKDVRGKGLMIGLEFTDLSERSPFFRASGKQGVLSLLVASYLLEYHHIRVLAPLTTMLKGNPGKNRLSIIRIQPPLTITDWDIQRLVSALKEVCHIIENNNEYCLVAHLVGTTIEHQERKNCQSFQANWPIDSGEQVIDARAGFVVHPINVETLVEYYFPSFSAYQWDSNAMSQWWNSISRFLEPVHVRNEYITADDFSVQLSLVFVPFLPRYINQHCDNRVLTKEMRDKVQDAVTVARELGDDNIPVSIVGLGAYTSIITQNAQTINDYEVPVTTGNAYTTGLTIQGILHAAEKRQLDISQARVAVVGAAGNIGTVLSQILLGRVGELILVGSQHRGSEYRLSFARQQCLQELLSLIASEIQAGVDITNTQITGHGFRIYQSLHSLAVSGNGSAKAIMEVLYAEVPCLDHAKLLDQLLTNSMSDYQIELTTDINDLQNCDIVIVSTNSEQNNLIQPELLKPDAIVCCTSVPSNLSPRFADFPNQLTFDGGLAQLPEESTINFVGMPKHGLSYGCLAETLVLAFDGQNHSYSKGMLVPEQVYDVIEKAALHGFSLGSLKFNDQALDLDAFHNSDTNKTNALEHPIQNV